MPNAGPIQQNILKELFIDTYKYKGIYDRDETTWPKHEIDDESEDMSSGTSLPTMNDLEDVYTMIFNKLNVKGEMSKATHLSSEIAYYTTKIKEAPNERTERRERYLIERLVVSEIVSCHFFNVVTNLNRTVTPNPELNPSYISSLPFF